MIISIPWLVFWLCVALGTVIGVVTAVQEKEAMNAVGGTFGGACVGAILGLITFLFCDISKTHQERKLAKEAYQTAVQELPDPWGDLYQALAPQSTVVRHALFDRFVETAGIWPSTEPLPQLTLKQYGTILQMPCKDRREECKSWKKAFASNLAGFIPNFSAKAPKETP